MNMFDSMYISMQNRMTRAKESIKEFWSAEKGVSNVVATIILLLIVVIIIGVFWDELSDWLSDLMGDIFDENNTPTADDLDV